MNPTNVPLSTPTASAATETTLLVHPADSGGCGFYRIRTPAKTLAFYNLVSKVTEAGYYLNKAQLEELNPSIIVTQRQTEPKQAENIVRYVNEGYEVVHELDDLLWLVPPGNAYSKYFKGPQRAALKTVLTASSRLVVSTDPLKDEVAKLARRDDVNVLPNMVSGQFFAKETHRRKTEKLRVGWAGSSTHSGDLRLIEYVIKHTYDKYHWVFLGWVPEYLVGHVEFLPPVKVEDYLPALASMNLDVAVAPLEDNLFNSCKSNLKLIEFSALGIPVITSNVYPYSGNPNFNIKESKKSWKTWLEALDTYDKNEELRVAHGLASQAYASQFMLEKRENVELIRKTWLGDKS